MSVTEVLLFLLGIILFIASFVIPEKKSKLNHADTVLGEKAVKELVENELENAKTRVEDIVEETVSYSIEKTERTLDRLTNEKMSAVNEFSDTILEGINKNHKEVMFLYDMLSDKQESINDTAQMVQQTAKVVKDTLKEAELSKIAEDVKEIEQSREAEQAKEEIQTKAVRTKVASTKKAPVKKTVKEFKPLTAEYISADIPAVMGSETGKNNNQIILELHKAGKSKMSIAKELGLGVGEVKLVIDLFEGM